MSILHRITTYYKPAPATLVVVPAVAPRLRYPDGAFAALVTDPAELADEAYAVFDQYRVTPGVAERHVARVLAAADALSCPIVETSPGFAYEVSRERTDLGRLRVFAHVLVQMQFAHETNLHELRAYRAERVKRVRILPGCCEVCDGLSQRGFRLSDAPQLPVYGCLRHGGCKCTYVPVTD